jgi:hypothetical protein
MSSVSTHSPTQLQLTWPRLTTQSGQHLQPHVANTEQCGPGQGAADLQNDLHTKLRHHFTRSMHCLHELRHFGMSGRLTLSHGGCVSIQQYDTQYI